MPHREMGSVVTNYETEMNIANTARWFGYAMPTAMSTRVRGQNQFTQRGKTNSVPHMALFVLKHEQIVRISGELQQSTSRGAMTSNTASKQVLT